jgi:hypothetical protein
MPTPEALSAALIYLFYAMRIKSWCSHANMVVGLHTGQVTPLKNVKIKHATKSFFKCHWVPLIWVPYAAFNTIIPNFTRF